MALKAEALREAKSYSLQMDNPSSVELPEPAPITTVQPVKNVFVPVAPTPKSAHVPGLLAFNQLRQDFQDMLSEQRKTDKLTNSTLDKFIDRLDVIDSRLERLAEKVQCLSDRQDNSAIDEMEDVDDGIDNTNLRRSFLGYRNDDDEKKIQKKF